MPLISLLTDYGHDDPFVGEMKAVILGVFGAASIVDLSHGVAPGAIREAAWILSRSWSTFPAGTCHLAVVDPGVGADRRPIAAAWGGHLFVGPDNGILGPALEMAADGSTPEVREIAVREIERVRRGSTFDGRDVFAPVAARLASGLPLAEVGPEIHDLVSLRTFAPTPAAGGWEGEIIRVDHYGNLVTTIEETFLKEKFGEDWRDVRVRVGDRGLAGIRLAYADVEAGELVLTIGGAGTLEISANRASARETVGVAPGERVRVERPGDDGAAESGPSVDEGWSRAPNEPKWSTRPGAGEERA